MSSSTITASSSASAFPTIGGQNIATPVRLIIGDTDSNAYEFSNSDLSVLLANALSYYQGLNPYTKESTITLVAEQQDYALPSDCIKPIHIPYRQVPSVTSDTTLIALYGLNGFISIVPYVNWTDSVLVAIQREFLVRYEQLGAGQAEEIPYLTSYSATRYLRLYPTPTASGSFVLRYRANHPLQSNDYFTIPSEHAIYVQKLLLAEIYDVRHAKQQSGVSEFAAGTTRIKVGGSKQSLSDLAAALRREVADALTSPIVIVG